MIIKLNSALQYQRDYIAEVVKIEQSQPTNYIQVNTHRMTGKYISSPPNSLSFIQAMKSLDLPPLCDGCRVKLSCHGSSYVFWNGNLYEPRVRMLGYAGELKSILDVSVMFYESSKVWERKPSKWQQVIDREDCPPVVREYLRGLDE